MANPFTFASRLCPVVFFEEDPITITLTVGDDFDRRILSANARLKEADSADTIEKRLEKTQEALRELIGEKYADSILSRAQTVDSLSVSAVYRYVLERYREHKVKNLTASAR